MAVRLCWIVVENPIPGSSCKLYGYVPFLALIQLVNATKTRVKIEYCKLQLTAEREEKS
jgi:hypothetical protein